MIIVFSNTSNAFTFVRSYPVYESFHISLLNYRRNKSPLHVKGKVKLLYAPGKCLHRKMFDSIQMSRKGSFSSVQQVTVRGKRKHNEHKWFPYSGYTERGGGWSYIKSGCRKDQALLHLSTLQQPHPMLSLIKNKHGLWSHTKRLVPPLRAGSSNH